MSWLLVALVAQAIDAINPSAICERFYLQSEIERCEVKVKQTHPDSYLAAVCQSFFDDEGFYDCLEMGVIATFDPIKLDTCMAFEGNDKNKMECIRSVATFENKKTEFQKNKRLPASLKKKAKRSKVLR
jgi:hypothetical protein